MRELIHEYRMRQAEAWERYKSAWREDHSAAWIQLQVAGLMGELERLSWWFAGEAAKL